MSNFMNACILLNISKNNSGPKGINFTYARAQKATACNIHGNAPK